MSRLDSWHENGNTEEGGQRAAAGTSPVRKRSKEEKRRIVEESFRPGTTVVTVARFRSGLGGLEPFTGRCGTFGDRVGWATNEAAA